MNENVYRFEALKMAISMRAYSDTDEAIIERAAKFLTFLDPQKPGELVAVPVDYFKNRTEVPF